MSTIEGDGPQGDKPDHLADLAFMKALVTEGPQMQASSGQLYMTAGLAYGVQCLFQWAELVGIVKYPGWLGLSVAILPTIVFLAVMTRVMWLNRKTKQHGVATRALNAVFSSTGLANLFMVVVFGYNAITQKSITIWLYYPIVVCAFQGAAWYAAYMIRKKLWMAVMSAGWFATTLAVGFCVYTPGNYVLVLAIALVVLMGGGGYVMVRQAQTNQAHAG
jgi:hypothetical protein